MSPDTVSHDDTRVRLHERRVFANWSRDGVYTSDFFYLIRSHDTVSDDIIRQKSCVYRTVTVYP